MARYCSAARTVQFVSRAWPKTLHLQLKINSTKSTHHLFMFRVVLSPFTQYNQFDNRLYRVYKHSTGCQTRLTTALTTGCIVYTAGCQSGCTTRFDNRLNEQWLLVQQGCQTGCIVQTNIQPVVKPV